MKPIVSEGLRQIGWDIWDPINLSRMRDDWKGRPFEDEYDRYMAKVAEMLTDECEDEEVVEYLFHSQSVTMGVSPSDMDEQIRTKLKAVVSAVRAALASQPGEACKCGRLEAAANDPQLPILYRSQFREWLIEVIDGGTSGIEIRYCPWCGSELADSVRDEWFDEISRLGFEPGDLLIPEEFASDQWWRRAAGNTSEESGGPGELRPL